MSAPDPDTRNTIRLLLDRKFYEYINSIDPDTILSYEKDDGKYNRIKYTILPKGTHLRFLSNKKLTHIESRPIWAEYSSLLGKKSFLDEDEDFSKIMQRQKGKYMNTIELLQDMTIIHFPINYNRIKTPIRNNTKRATTLRIKRNLNISADLEGYIHLLCVNDEKRVKYSKQAGELMKYTSICRDGYTMDFFYKLSGNPLAALAKIRKENSRRMAGFREICITNVTPETIRLVSSEHLPVSSSEMKE